MCYHTKCIFWIYFHLQYKQCLLINSPSGNNEIVVFKIFPPFVACLFVLEGKYVCTYAEHRVPYQVVLCFLLG